MEAFSGKDPPEDEASSFEGAATDVAAMVVAQPLLVPSYADGGLVPSPLESQVFSLELVLDSLVEGTDSQRAVLELGGKDRFCPIDEEESSFSCWLGRCCAYRP